MHVILPYEIQVQFFLFKNKNGNVEGLHVLDDKDGLHVMESEK